MGDFRARKCGQASPDQPGDQRRVADQRGHLVQLDTAAM